MSAQCTYELDVDRRADGSVAVVTLWEMWGARGLRSPWRWENPPSVRKALAEGKKFCREIFGVEPRVMKEAR
jgi:hypothetical protein